MKTIEVDGKRYQLKKYRGELSAGNSVCDQCAFIGEACTAIPDTDACCYGHAMERFRWVAVRPRHPFGRLTIGRLELEAGWYRGEDWAIEVQALRLHAGHALQVLYVQVAKACLSIAIDIRPDGQRREEE